MKHLLFALCFVKVCACTDFVLADKQGNIVNGRSLEFGTFLDTKIAFYPKGKSWQSRLEKGAMGMKWTNTYSFASVTVFDTDFSMDGMNDQGLSFGILWFPGAQYPKVDMNDPADVIHFTDVGNWLLGSFRTVDEVAKALKKVQIQFGVFPQIGQVPPIHLTIHDRNGKSLVVEFIDGKMEILPNAIGVLTNAPKFQWHVTNLSNYINLSAVNKSALSFDGSVLSPTGQGSGLLGLPGDWTPPSRFVRIALFKGVVTPAEAIEENIKLAYHLLNTVDIPYGGVQSSEGSDFDYTQWVVVKDLSSLIFSYRTYYDLCPRAIDLRELQKSNEKKTFPMKGARITP